MRIVKTPTAAPLLTRAATIAPQSIDETERTAELIWSTGAAVTRRDPWTGERYIEALSLDPRHVDLSRLRAGAPVLDSHAGHSVDNVLGSVVSATVANGEGRAVVKFSRRPAVEAIFRDIVDGVLKAVSIGYTIEEIRETKGDKGKLPTRTAVRWTPHEISLVPIGADPGAAIRSDDMTETQTQTTDAVVQERERAASITSACRAAGMPDLAQRFIVDGTSIDAVRAAVLDEMARRGGDDLGPGRVPSGAPRYRTDEVGDDFRAAASDALLLRAGITPGTVHPGARDVEASILGIARTCVSRAGKTVRGGSAEMLVRQAQTTSDFPLILADALHKSIRRGYEVEPASHRGWVRVASLRDFRPNHRPILGSGPSLLQVLEMGEYTQGAMDEDSTSYSAAKYGRIVALSWECLVNDDLDAFLRVQPALGQAARRLEADLVYVIFTTAAGAGPNMQDSVALFHSNHGNITTAHAALDATALGEARELLRMQTALGGGYMSLVPRHLIVAPAQEQAAEVLLAASSRVRFGDSNESTEGRPSWLSSLDLVVEPRLAGLDAAYLAAGNDQIDTIELGLLEANVNGPMIETEDKFIQDVRAWKVRHVAGAKALDWRGLVKIDISGS